MCFRSDGDDDYDVLIINIIKDKMYNPCLISALAAENHILSDNDLCGWQCDCAVNDNCMKSMITTFCLTLNVQN